MDGRAIMDSATCFDPYASFRHSFARASARHPIDKTIHSDLQIRLPDHANMIVDRMSMAHSLEMRCPLLDHKLAEFAARLTVGVKVRGCELRYLHKRLGGRYMSKDFLAHKKQGFSSSLIYLIEDELIGFALWLLLDSELVKHEIVRKSLIEQIVLEHRHGKANHARRLWLLFNCESWFRVHIQGLSQNGLATAIAAGAKGGHRLEGSP